MGDLTNNNLKWLLEQNHNDYLTWVALWLACMLGILTILTAIASKPNILTTAPHFILVLSMYIGLVSGTLLSVWKLSNIIKLGVRWMKKIGDEALKRELKPTRGSLSKFVVRDDGTICGLNRFLALVAHMVVAFVLFLLASLPYITQLL